MSQNKQTVEAYVRAFGQSDHAGVLACLTDDVEWVLPGVFEITGKPRSTRRSRTRRSRAARRS